MPILQYQTSCGVRDARMNLMVRQICQKTEVMQYLVLLFMKWSLNILSSEIEVGFTRR